MYLDSCLAHDKDLTCMQILPDKDTLVTASKDKNMKFWYPPSSWKKEDPSQPSSKMQSKKKTVIPSRPVETTTKSKAKGKAKKVGSDSDEDSSDEEVVIVKKKPVAKKA